MDLPMKLVSLRKEKGLTQLELAEYLHVSRQAISRWEVGTAVPNTDNLKYLSELYGVSVDYLLNDNADNSCNITEIQEQTPEVPPQAESKRKHSYIFICILGIVVAIVIGIVIGATVIPRKEGVYTNPTDKLYIETKSQSDGTFCFD